VLLYDFKNDLNRYLTRLPLDAPARTLEALIGFNEQHRAQEMPYFEQEQFIQAQAKGPLTDPAIAKRVPTVCGSRAPKGSMRSSASTGWMQS